ncbi:MAG: hypothetical protein GTN81_06350 [Proteobacteria bacterium]|nr:hypothetical protein [Pseudomonadota bacterium]
MDFNLHLEALALPKRSLPVDDLISSVRKHLDILDPDEVESREENFPKWYYRTKDVAIVFRATAKPPEERGKPGCRAVTSRFYGEFIDLSTPIRKKITKKGKHYKGPDLPYIIAINALSRYGVEQSDVMRALFGQEEPVLRPHRSHIPEAYPHGIPAGAFLDRSGFIYTRVSAVLIAHKLHLGNLGKASLRLYHHPHCRKPYTSVLTCLPQAIPQGDRMIFQDGEKAGDILGLPRDWPWSN